MDDLPIHHLRADYQRRAESVRNLGRAHARLSGDLKQVQWSRWWISLLSYPRRALGRSGIDAWLWVVIFTTATAVIFPIIWATLLTTISIQGMLLGLVLTCIASAIAWTYAFNYPPHIEEYLLDLDRRIELLRDEKIQREQDLNFVEPKLLEAKRELARREQLEAALPKEKPSTFGTRCVAVDGHDCLSLEEKFVDDFLFARGIPHQREVPYPGHRGFRVDFVVKGVFIEYFGMAGNDNYDKRIIEKRRVCDEENIRLIEIYREDLNFAALEHILATYGLLRHYE